MEALMMFLFGLFLLFPCIQLIRQGSHILLSVRVAPVFVLLIIGIPFSPSIYSFLSAGKHFSQYRMLDFAGDYLWVAGWVMCSLYIVSIVVQYLRGKGEGKRDKWAILEARAESLLASGDIEGAISRYKEALRLDSKNFKGHYRFARILLRSGFYKMAYEHLLLTVEHCPMEYRRDMIKEGRKLLIEKSKDSVLVDNFSDVCRRRFPG